MALQHGATAKYFQGELPQTSDFAVFVGKFAFDYDPDHEPVGEFTVQVDWVTQDHPPSKAGSGKLLGMIFDDEPQHWLEAQHHWAGTTCEEKQAYANSQQSLNEALWNSVIRERIRPRYWYLAIV